MTGSRDITLEVLNAAVDAVVDIRVRLHRGRGDGLIGVPTYKDGLKAIRDVEDLLEPLRRELGCEHSRAYERAIADRGTALAQIPSPVPAREKPAEVSPNHPDLESSRGRLEGPSRVPGGEPAVGDRAGFGGAGR